MIGSAVGTVLAVLATVTVLKHGEPTELMHVGPLTRMQDVSAPLMEIFQCKGMSVHLMMVGRTHRKDTDCDAGFAIQTGGGCVIHRDGSSKFSEFPHFRKHVQCHVWWKASSPTQEQG